MAKKYNSTNNQEFKLQLTKNQKQIINFFIDNQISILTGDPGTGKTTLALYYALKQLINKEFEKIIISKSPVETGFSIGFLPGELDEKLAPYKQSYIDVISKIVGDQKAGELIRSNKIIFEPVGFVRGKTFDYACVILDESQNLSLQGLMSFVTRVSDSSKMIMLGDQFQNDIGHKSGFKDFINIAGEVDGIGFKELGDEFQMRSKLITDLFKRYKNFCEK